MHKRSTDATIVAFLFYENFEFPLNPISLKGGLTMLQFVDFYGQQWVAHPLPQTFRRVFRWILSSPLPWSGTAAQHKEFFMPKVFARPGQVVGDDTDTSVGGRIEPAPSNPKERADPGEESVVAPTPGRIAGVPMAEFTNDEVSVVERVLDSAAEYIAINTSHPKLPGNQLPFSLTVQFLRCLRGLTQHQLAQACDVKQCYVSMIEKEQGKVPDDAILRIKRFLELPEEKLESEDAEPNRTAEEPVNAEEINA